MSIKPVWPLYDQTGKNGLYVFIIANTSCNHTKSMYDYFVVL